MEIRRMSCELGLLLAELNKATYILVVFCLSFYVNLVCLSEIKYCNNLLLRHTVLIHGITCIHVYTYVGIAL